MREYNRVSPRFWTEAQVEEWTDEEKILGLYLLTCEARTTEGIYRLTWQTVSGDLDWSLETVTATVSKLFAKGFLKYDETARVVFLPSALKYQRPDNDNQVKGAVRNILALPKTTLIADFVSAANQHSRKLYEALSEPLANRYPNGFEYSSSSSSSNSSSKEPSAAKASPPAAIPKLKALSDTDWQAEADRLLGSSAFAAQLERLGQLMAAENKTGEVRVSRLVKELYEPLIALEAEIPAEAMRYGLEEAIRHGAPNKTYVRKAAAKYRPVHVPAAAPRSQYDDLMEG